MRNVKVGDQIPEFRMNTIGGKVVAKDTQGGRVRVLVYLSAEQSNSERCAIDAQRIVRQFQPSEVDLLLVTADVVYKSYFEQLLRKSKIGAPLAFDGNRDLYRRLGLIVFPVTMVIAPGGRIEHVISARGMDYGRTLDAQIRHAMGTISDAEYANRLKSKGIDHGSKKSAASRHRVAARVLREKGFAKDAEKELREALRIAPKENDIRLDLAELLLNQNRAGEAQPLIDEVLASNSKNRRAKLLLGISLFQGGQLDEAERVLQEALVLNPDPARTHYYLGAIAEQRGQMETALKHYKEAADRALGECCS
jgi:tetratricopeptide (TPR) repeat protein